MNNLMLLTIISAALLAGAVIFSLGSLGNSETREAEKQKLRQEIALLNLNNTAVVPPRPVITEVAPSPTAAEMEALRIERQELERLRNEQAQLAQQPVIEEPVEELAPPPVDPTTDERFKRRANLVSKAMLMASVEQYLPDDDFVVIRVQNSNNVVQGAKLAIRRRTGIIGQLEVTTVEGGQAIANPIPQTFLGGEVDIQPGDELIVPVF